MNPVVSGIDQSDYRSAAGFDSDASEAAVSEAHKSIFRSVARADSLQVLIVEQVNLGTVRRSVGAGYFGLFEFNRARARTGFRKQLQGVLAGTLIEIECLEERKSELAHR